MQHKTSPIESAILEGVLIIAVIALIPQSGLMLHSVSACPHCWIGNDDGEFDWNQHVPNYVSVSESINTALTWNNYNCSTGVCNGISLQYNPDWYTSYVGNRFECNTWDPCWFQSIIGVDPNNCATFWVQVYDMSTGGQVWAQSIPGGGGCNNVGGVTGARSYWLIEEDTIGGGNQVINDVYYQLEHCTDPYCNGYTWISGTIYTPHQWNWLRSNICWCGANGPSTVNFNTAGGTSYMYSDQPLFAVGPPNDLSTSENSNMLYGCINGSGSTSMNQNFGLNGHC